MALVIENGTGVANATSFATVAEARAFATMRGVTLPADDTAVEVLLIKAMDYIAAFESRYDGVRSFVNQSLPFPRDGLRVWGLEYTSPDMPPIIKQLQLQLVLEQHSGVNILPSSTSTARSVKRKKIGPIETEYFEGGSANAGLPTMTAVKGLLSPLFGPSTMMRVGRG